MRDAFAAHHLGRALEPKLMHVEGVGGEFHVKGGGLAVGAGGTGSAGRTYFALKANGGFFGNAARGLPSIRGVILLFDASSGDVLAVMDSRDITAIRTAATTALAIDLLSRTDARVATMCGCGGQARRHLAGLLMVRPSISVVQVWSRDARRAEAFCREHGANFGACVRLEPAGDVRSAVRRSDVVMTCTPSRRFFLGADDVRAGTMIAAVGADSPDKQELEPALVARGRVVVDLLEQCARVGELHHAIDAGLMQRAGVHAELGAIAAGAVRGGWDAGGVTIFDSTGTALQDAAAAALVYERAEARGAGTQVDFME